MSESRIAVSAIFLDDGGVLNDNDRRAPQWQRLVGEYLSPRLGGDRAAWAEANRVVFEGCWQRWEQALRDASGDGYPVLSEFWTRERRRWLREMCQHVGVAAPADEDCLRVAEETEAYVIPRVRAAYPGAVEALRELHAHGYTLNTASGSSSEQLADCLAGMGVRELFPQRLYGPDLLNVRKDSPQFYESLLEDTGIEPADAVVLDDSEQQLRFAAEAGARTVLVSAEPPTTVDADAAIAALSELQSILRRA